MASLLLGRPVEVPEQLMQHYSVLGQVSAENRPRRHPGEGLTCSWGGRCGFQLDGGPKNGYQGLNTLLTVQAGRGRIESVPRGLRNVEPPKQ